MITISRLYDDYATASRAVDELERAGIPHSDISIVASNAEGWYDRDRTTSGVDPAHDRDHDGRDDRAEGAAAGAGIGATLGGVAGLLAGLGMLAIPGIGPVVAAGWLASTAAVAAVGGTAGGLIGALTQSGVDEREANAYAEGVRRGGTLVTARVPETDRARYEAILDRSAVNITDRSAIWERNGWNRFDPAAPAYTPDESAASARRIAPGCNRIRVFGTGRPPHRGGRFRFRRFCGSYGSGAAQRGDVVARVAELLQNGLGIGADFRSGAAQRARRLGEFDRKAEHLDGAVAGVFLAQHHLLIEHLRIGEHLAQSQHAAAGDSGGVQFLNPIRGRSGAQARLDRLVDRRPVRDAQVVRQKTRVPAQFGHPERIDQTLIGLLLARRQRDLAVRGAEHAVGRDDRVIVTGTARLRACRQMVGGEIGEEADQPVVEARLRPCRPMPVRPRRTSAAQIPSAPGARRPDRRSAVRRASAPPPPGRSRS